MLFFCSLTMNAQHFPIYSQYMMNGMAINPAYAGSREVVSLLFSQRWQWVGFDGAPTTTGISAHMPTKSKTVAFGLQVLDERIGVTNNLSVFGNYAYRVRMGTGRLSLGFKAGVEVLKENLNMITLPQKDDPTFTEAKPTSYLPNFGFGAYYYNDKFFAGLSVPSLLSYRESSTGSGFSPYNNVQNYNFLLTGGVIFKINDNVKVKPSTLLRFHANSPLQYDLNCNVILFKDDLLWVGTSYRSKEAFVGLFEFQVNTQLRVGYSYDYTLGPLSKYSSGSHEIVLRYELRYKINAVNPRYF
jgi:type IX secretion system PorP/SprF family membrane protein